MDGKQITAAEVEARIAEIKASMPKTYKAIVERAAGPMGKAAYQLVRRGLRGERNCFYARERIRGRGCLDQWIAAGTSDGMKDVLPEQLEQELNTVIELIFVLNNPDSARACTTEGGDGAH